MKPEGGVYCCVQKALKTLNVAPLVNAGAALLKETTAIKRFRASPMSHKPAKMVNWLTRNAAPKQDFLEKGSLGHGNSGKIKVNNRRTFTSFRKVLKVEPFGGQTFGCSETNKQLAPSLRSFQS